MKKKPTDIGMNRTGVATSPVASKKAADAAAAAEPSSRGDALEIANVRAEYIRDAEPVGAMPPPASLKGVATTAVDVIKGTRPTVLLDKLGERLAFERTGTRLYEAMITKCKSAKVREGVPPISELRQIHDDELSHFEMLRETMIALGADPTVQTPCADVSGVASMGLLQVVSDPRTTPIQCLEAILIAELADNDSWTMLMQLAEAVGGHEKLVENCRIAIAAEERHLELVRGWLSAGVTRDAGVPSAGV